MVVPSELSEGSSSSSTHGHIYDVFLSFRGLDTRHGFTAHLHKAFMEANIITFLDDEEIDSGVDLKPELESAIKASRASVIVLSKNYASSTWCLNELVLILEQRITSDHIVFPIFYHVVPTHVRKQQSRIGDAMAKHRRLMEAETNASKRKNWAQKMKRWNKALIDVASLKGMDVNGESRSLLKKLSRTSTVDYIYPQGVLNHTFLGWTIRLNLSLHGLKMLPHIRQIYSLFWVWVGSVFVVLDDIDSLIQLDALLESKSFNPGSKIIITTRDAWLTESCAMFKTNVKPTHAKHLLHVLHKSESRELLCYHAFMSNDPKVGYEEVTEKLVDYCEGHPMALKVLGRSLHNRDVAYWEGFIEGLKKENRSPVNNVLRMSFDSLPTKDNKDLFKHIACFFVGMDRDVAETILEACDIETRTGITNLIDRCLLSIGWSNELMMHQLVQEMGRFVVREESPEKPWERSRLWGHESFKVLKLKKDTENVLGLTLDMRMLEKEKLRGPFELETEALREMNSLMLLQLNYVQISGSYENFPEELRWLCMHGFPLKSIPSELLMENLVALDMSYSNIQSFGVCYSYPQGLYSRLKQLIGSSSKDKRILGSLKILNLSFCEQLCILGGFDQLPALERLVVRHCTGLLEVCDSVEQCVELVSVDLSYCNKLEKLPRNLGTSKKVKTLLLDGCFRGESRIKIRDMDSLDKLKANNIDTNRKTSFSAVLEAIPSDSKLFTISLPRSLVRLSLANNNLSTESFPMDFICLSMLEELYLDENPIVSMPNCVRSLPKLKILSMKHCKMLMNDQNQAMVGVEGKVLRSLGWTELDFLKERRLGADTLFRGLEESEIQMYYEFGIFSTIYGGQEMPNWITDRSKGTSISFIIPSSSKQLRGLNFCYMQMRWDVQFQFSPLIVMSNITKNRTWIYNHYVYKVNVGGDSIIFLSHWMFGMNEMEGDDHVTITVAVDIGDIKECGVSLVYEDLNEEEVVLGYYKSWNHIIGKDLTAFQSTTGEYILDKRRILAPCLDSILLQAYWHLCGEGARFKDEQVNFRAFSQRKSGVHVPGDGP